MKLPKDIKSRHKIRDFNICRLYIEEQVTAKTISETIGLTERRVGQILRENKIFLSPDRDWERAKQINRAKRKIKDLPDSKRDVLEWEEFLYKLVHGDKPLIDQSQHTHFEFKYEGLDAVQVRASRRTDGSMEQPGKVEGISSRPEVREDSPSGSRANEESPL